MGLQPRKPLARDLSALMTPKKRRGTSRAVIFGAVPTVGPATITEILSRLGGPKVRFTRGGVRKALDRLTRVGLIEASKMPGGKQGGPDRVLFRRDAGVKFDAVLLKKHVAPSSESRLPKGIGGGECSPSVTMKISPWRRDEFGHLTRTITGIATPPRDDGVAQVAQARAEGPPAKAKRRGSPLEAGQLFGKLRVVGRAPPSADGRHRFLVKCECGVQKSVSSDHLRSGATVSCGCEAKERRPKHKAANGSQRRVDGTGWAIGRRYGKLVVVRCEFKKRGAGKKAYTVCSCRCDCGNDHVALLKHLKNGHTKSCGCQKRELVGERSRRHGEFIRVAFSPWVA